MLAGRKPLAHHFYVSFFVLVMIGDQLMISSIQVAEHGELRTGRYTLQPSGCIYEGNRAVCSSGKEGAGR